MRQPKPILHGRDHGPGGADPIPGIVTSPLPSLEGELDYVELTGNVNVTATVAASADTVIDGNAVTLDGLTKIRVELSLMMDVDVRSSGSAGALIVTLWDGGTSLGGVADLSVGAGSYTAMTMVRSVILTPSAGSHTYHVKAYKTNGTCQIYELISVADAFKASWYRVTT